MVSIRDGQDLGFSEFKRISGTSLNMLYRNLASNSFKIADKRLVAYAKNEPVGYLLLKNMDLGDSSIGLLMWGAVMPEFRGKHIGSELVETALTYFKANGIREVYSATTKDNIPSIKMLKRNNFKIISFNEILEKHGLAAIKLYINAFLFPNKFILRKLI
jgi:ribosomal protein S18 acetylase RimI-like enzyme